LPASTEAIWRALVLIPLHDENPLRHIRFQYVTVALIAACVVVFLYQSGLPPAAGERFIYRFGAIPAVLFGHRELPPDLAAIPAHLTLASSMFLHGGWMHLIGNMLFLWVVGDNVEDSLGHGRFVAFYLVCGVAAAMAHAATDTQSTVPMIGASGAISGVIGAYLVLHPRAPIHTLVLRMVVRLPAYVVLGLWAGLQAINALGSLGAAGGVAWWAHVGGFVAGAILIVPLRRRGVPLLDRGFVPPPPRRARSRVPDTRGR
jgi:membrane associated rhomboid family serine protease